MSKHTTNLTRDMRIAELEAERDRAKHEEQRLTDKLRLVVREKAAAEAERDRLLEAAWAVLDAPDAESWELLGQGSFGEALRGLRAVLDRRPA